MADFARFLGRSPDRTESEVLRRDQLYLAAHGGPRGKMNATVSALRFFFKVALGRPASGVRLATMRKAERLSVVLSFEEVALLLHCAPALKHKASRSVSYGRGLHASKIARLKVSGIDSARMRTRNGHQLADPFTCGVATGPLPRSCIFRKIAETCSHAR